MSILTLAAVLGLVFGLIAEFEANGRNWSGWGVVALSVGVLWTNLR